MMSQHLDIKLFTEILKEIKNVSFNNQRSVSTNVDIFCTSDSEREENFIPGDRDQLRPPPITPLKGSPRSVIRNNSFMKKVRNNDKSERMLKVFAELNHNQLGEAVGDRPHYHPGDDC